MFFDIVNHFIDGRKCQPYVAVCCAIVNGDPAALGIMGGSAGEAYIRYKSSLLIPLFRCQQEVLTTIFYDGRVVNIQDRSTDGIDITVSGSAHTMIEQ